MSHSSPGKEEMQDLKGLAAPTAESFAYFLAAMYQFEQLNINFMKLLGDDLYKRNNPYEYMLLEKFFKAHAETMALYKSNLLNHFWPKTGGDNKKYLDLNQFLNNYLIFSDKYKNVLYDTKYKNTNPKPDISVFEIAEIFCNEQLGMKEGNSAETKRTIEFINSLLSDDIFCKALTDEIFVCIALHSYANKSRDIQTLLKIRDEDKKADNPLAISWQFIAKIPLLMETIVKTGIKVPNMDFPSLKLTAQEMALAIKTPQDYNTAFTFNVARLLTTMQSLDATKDQTMLNLLKLSAALPRIHDNSKIHKISLSKEELQTIAEIRACMDAEKGSEIDELRDVLDDINKLFTKVEAIPEVKENPVNTKVPTKITVVSEYMDYALNRYLYAFTPPKPNITAAEAETILKYIHEHKPKLTAHSVLVLQNSESARSKSALGTATAAMSKLSVIKRRTSSTASEQTMKGADSPPRVASPENLVAAGFSLDEVFPLEVSGMKMPPPPIPKAKTEKAGAPSLPDRTYRKSTDKRDSVETKPTGNSAPPLPSRRPVMTKTAEPVTKPVIEAKKPPAPIVTSKQEKRISFPKGDGGATTGTGLPTDELAKKLDYRRKKSDAPPPPPRGRSPSGSSL